MYKKQVNNAINALRDTLVRFGANPFRIDLPKPVGFTKVGVDDFIIKNGKKAKQAFESLECVPLFLSEGISASELLQKEFAPLVWVVPNLLPAGLSFFAGKPKIGKSWFVLSLVLAIASGRRVLEYYDCENDEEITVLYLALEDSESRMKTRIQKIAPDFYQGKYADRAIFQFSWPSCEGGGLLALERWLEQNPKCKAVFIDTFARVRRLPKSVSYYEDYEATSDLKRIADRFKIALFVVHHTRKQGSDDPFEMISGTTGVSGSADSNFVLVRDRNSLEGVLHVTGRDIEEQELALSFNEGIWKVLGDSAPLHISKAHNEILLALIEAGKPLSLSELAKESGRKVGGFKKTADRMVREGIMKRNTDLKYEHIIKKTKFNTKHQDN